MGCVTLVVMVFLLLFGGAILEFLFPALIYIAAFLGLGAAGKSLEAGGGCTVSGCLGIIAFLVVLFGLYFLLSSILQPF